MRKGQRKGHTPFIWQETGLVQERFENIVTAVADENNADVFIYAGPLNEDSWRAFMGTCPDETGRANAVLYLTTYGGDAATAYRITRFLQRRYEKITVIVDSMCKSAGTLIAVGAHTIVMTDRGELGPLDVQIGQQDELYGLQSGLVTIQALETLQEQSFSYFETGFLKLTSRSGGRITTRTAAELASSLAGALFGQLYAQLDPMRLGENYRQMLVSREYATRLARTGNVTELLDRLITSYPSHGFVIDRAEAMNLFPDVREASASEIALAGELASVANAGLWDLEPTVEHLTSDPVNIAVKFRILDEKERTDVEAISESEEPLPSTRALRGDDPAREFATDGVGH